MSADDRIEKLREQAAELPRTAGVYLMKDAAGRVIYIGKAKSLRSRVSSYFRPSVQHDPKTAQMVAAAAQIDVLEAPSEVDAFLMESRLIKDVQPKYNINLRDAKTFPFLEVTRREDYARVHVTREPARASRVFGPFARVYALRRSLGVLQKVFRFRTCDLDIARDDPRRRFHRPCILFYINSCLGPCGAKCSDQEYAEAIQMLLKFLSGKRSAVMRALERRMLAHSRALEYEWAGRIRDQLKALASLDEQSQFTDNLMYEALAVDFKRAGRDLKKRFALAEPPRLIEGIDIANLAGQEAVGSVVTFVDGSPNKSGYRRYKIRTVEGIDDYAMIREVLTRRYRRARGEDAPLPHIILIDGGKGHLAAAREALDEAGVRGPLLLSLAKREEEIFREDADDAIRLDEHTPASRLLRFVRDEAHRFAQHYHHLLRSKRLSPSPHRKPKKRSLKRGRPSSEK